MYRKGNIVLARWYDKIHKVRLLSQEYDDGMWRTECIVTRERFLFYESDFIYEINLFNENESVKIGNSFGRLICKSIFGNFWHVKIDNKIKFFHESDFKNINIIFQET